MPLLAATPRGSVLHDTDACTEAVRHDDKLVEVSIDDAVGLINDGEARPCGNCIGRAESIGHVLPEEEAADE